MEIATPFHIPGWGAFRCDDDGNVIGAADCTANLQHGKEVWVIASGKTARLRDIDHGDVVQHEVKSPLE